MTQQIINVGAAPNDGQGDPIRDAFIKCNDNFNQLFSTYTAVPPTLYGQAGDVARMYADNANYFYYCFQDYTDGSQIIWAKISEVDTTSYISNGNTSVAIPTTNGSILFDVGNVSNVMVMTTDGFTLTGNANISKNIVVSNNANIGNTMTTVEGVVSNDLFVGNNTIIAGDTSIAGNLAVTGLSTFSDDVTVNANLTVNGNITYINVDELKVTDPLIQLAANNANADVLDIGFYGEWNDGVFQYGGLARDASDGDWKLFSNVTTQPTTVVDFTNAVYDNLKIGNLKSENIFNSGNVNVIGNVNVTANVNANNATITNNTVTGGNATVIGNILGGNIRSLGNVEAVANINANNATITNNAVIGGNTTVVGNILGGNIRSLGNVEAVANINANNATITNNVIAGGNVIATGLVTSGLYWSNGSPIISNTGNLTLNSIVTTGNASIGGNIIGTNAILSANVFANNAVITNDINANNEILTGYLLADRGSFINNVAANNASFTTDLDVGGDTVVTGAITANNITALNEVTATGNLSGLGLTVYGNTTVNGNTSSGNISSLGNITATANVNAANATITNNVVAGNLITGGNVNATGNINATANVNANNATITNNVTVGGTMFTGNIIPSANVTYTLGNATNQWKDLWVSNATIYLNSVPITMSNASVLLWNSVPLISSVTDQNLTSTGNIVAGNVTSKGFFFANGSPVVTASGNVASNNIVAIGFADIGGNIDSGANIEAASTVIAPNASLGNIRIAGNVISTTTTDPDMYLDPFNGGGTVGTVYVLGNLQVAGNLTTVNSNTVAITSLLFQSANNAPNPAAADGGGLAVGPANSSYATWTYAVTSNSWTSNLPITATGGANINGPITNVTNISANGTITAANFTGTLTTAAQPNITSVGTLANLTVSTTTTTANLVVSGIANLSTANTQLYSLGVGTAASGVLGEIRAANNITGYYSSDSKFKENIVDISEPANKVKAIGGKMFDWTDEYIADRGGLDNYFLRKHDFGVIAQDVQTVFPEAVHERPDGSLAVDYPKLSALAFAAINELSEKFSSEIAELRSEIEQLKGK